MRSASWQFGCQPRCPPGKHRAGGPRSGRYFAVAFGSRQSTTKWQPFVRPSRRSYPGGAGRLSEANRGRDQNTGGRKEAILFELNKKKLTENDTCRHCIHLAADQNARRFFCRRFPPVRYLDIAGSPQHGWPEVNGTLDDWCGEFQKKESGKIRRFFGE